ncbi:MAG TPA: type II toxin-antitoxin system HicB family antitoxin [Candidatus Acidoferrales bacterium]|nr:type II toxin-antitoxin system HicB family antitoxin [Candidatus Acidoferrales bacterium]
MDYIAYLHKDRKSDFGVSFPDFPGCITAGKTLQESRRNAEEALALHISGIIEDGETIPEPSTLDDIAEDPAMKNAVAILVNVDSEKRVRVNITARESQIERIDRLAEQAGMTRSAYFVQAALEERARRDENSGLQRRSSAQRPGKHRLKTESTARPARKPRVLGSRTDMRGGQDRTDRKKAS